MAQPCRLHAVSPCRMHPSAAARFASCRELLLDESPLPPGRAEELIHALESPRAPVPQGVLELAA